jgi:hypothetical protein
MDHKPCGSKLAGKLRVLLLFLGELGGHALAWAVPNLYNMDHFVW